MADRTNEETETALSQNAANRSEWELFSEDPVWQRRVEALGIEPTRTQGDAKWYTLRADQVVIRKGKRKVSPEQAAAFRERMAAAAASAE